MKLTFLGAAKQVTGSMYLLEVDEYKILIDCGQDLEKPKIVNSSEFDQNKKLEETFAQNHIAKQRNNQLFPFEASEIDVVILTHAHIDHTGMIPLLYKEGYEGQVLCTTPTFYLTKILLHDAALLYQKRLKKVLDKGRNSKKVPQDLSKMFFTKHVDESLDRFVTIPINQKFKLTNEISVFFNNAGHLLGAANLVFKVKENGIEKSICFSGDIGRFSYPLLQDPQMPPQVDYLVCESTYGNRLHKNIESPVDALYRIIKQTCVENKGRLIIPAFSVGRSQALFHSLSKMWNSTDLPKVPVYADSPMAYESSKVYEKFVNLLNKEAKTYFEDNDELFDFENFNYVSDLRQSKRLSDFNEPSIIISSSGMISGGRIEHHVRQNIENSKATICIIGYCAEGTMGFDLMNGAKEIKIKNKTLEVRAQIEVIDAFSAHGDQNDLLNFVKSQQTTVLKNIFLTHGDELSMETLKGKILDLGYNSVEIPEKGVCYEL
jgi:metallo-beta-lactamase family protein